MRQRIVLIANPISGGDSRPKIAAAKSCLEAQGAQVEVLLTAKRGDARTFAAGLDPNNCDLTIAAGGDGTLNEVANGLAGRGIPLAFLPLGTVNVMALEMGIPRDIEKACRVALHGAARPVCLGEAGGELFFMMAGIGYDAMTVRNVNLKWKRHIGKLAYLWAGIPTLLKSRPQPLTVTTAEGNTFTAYHLVISNIRLYGGRHVLVPYASLEQPQLTACYVDTPSRLELYRFWMRVMLGLPLLGSIKRIDSERFSIDGASAPVQVDGDDVGDTPLTVTSRPGLLQMIFPPPR